MPIRSIEKQLDERGVLGNLPRLGTLRKGDEKTEKGTVGKDLKYLRLTLEPQYEPIIRPHFEARYGTEPESIDGVLLAADSADKAFDYWFEQWTAAKLVNRCDGETITVHFDDRIQRYDNAPSKCTCAPLNRTCGYSGRLDVVLPDVCEAAGLWGKITLLTTSQYDCIALASYMRVAGAFMNRLSNVAFWSVPFTIGRAPREVPVTINGKRSRKTMSLLYAIIDPEFNQKVVSPMLRQPTQLLLAGVNPETGEVPAGGLPEITVEQTRNWDWDYVKDQTAYLFDHDNHQTNTLNKMIDDGEITDDMDDFGVVSAVEINRTSRATEKQRQNAPQSTQEGANSSAPDEQGQSDIDWATNAKTVAVFVKAAHTQLGLKTGDVLNALTWASGQPLENLQDFRGTKNTAWAACIVHRCKYDSKAVRKFLNKPGEEIMRDTALQMISARDIPF